MIVPLTLRAENITVQVGAKALLDRVTLSLPPRSLTALLGPNGSGKTTLIRALLGAVKLASGEVYVGDTRLSTLSRTSIARACAYLPQQTGTSFELRVEDAVALGRYPHLGRWGALQRTDFERIAWAIERTGLAHLRQRTLPTLSGGERQRVFIARALAQQAPILLLDEPTAALDIGRQLSLMALLAELNQEGYTILAALHDLRSALEFFPRTLLLDAGKLIADGPTTAIIQSPELAAAFGVQVSRREDWCFQAMVR